MKKFLKSIVKMFLIVLVLNPILVKANIICNDGTISPSCTDCHRGCCSKHGGCSNNSSNSSSSLNGNNNSTPGSNSVYEQPIVTEEPKSDDTSIKKVTIDDIDIPISASMNYSTTKENVKILVVANDEKATVTYPENPSLSIGENIIDIKVTAESSKIKEYKLLITREKILSDNKNIKVFINEKEIEFNLFKSDVINIDNDIDKLNISYELEDSNATAEIIGNENLQVGYNKIIVGVTAENGERQDYTIIVEKEEKEIPKEEETIETELEEDLEEETETIPEEEMQEKTDSNSIPGIIICILGVFTIGYKTMKNKL